MIRIKPDQCWVLITNGDGTKKLYQANMLRGEAEGMAAGINMMGSIAGQRAEAVGFYPIRAPKEIDQK